MLRSGCILACIASTRSWIHICPFTVFLFGSLACVGYPASPRLDSLPFFCCYAVMPFPSMKETIDSLYMYSFCISHALLISFAFSPWC
jgi:hypothetical protein